MTVNYSFDLEDDDFLDDTFRNIPEHDLLSHCISSEKPVDKNEMQDFQSPGPSGGLKHSSANTEKHTKNSLSFLLKSKQNVSEKQNGVDFFEICSPNKAVYRNETTKINSRFVPGFTPKAKKRKLPGPAGFFSENDDQHVLPVDSELSITKRTTAEIEIQNITNSQFSSDDLLLSSWQNLQGEVSCHNLLSTIKYYSIRRVLHETSRKKLPKHLVVPVLCVLIKKFNTEESTLVFMDDTGEISGKIDREVLDVYKDAIQERTALILKKVTCICNILILKKQNVVSIYRDDGTVKHVQDLNSILEKDEPLKPMNCQCPGTPDEQRNKRPSFSTPVSSKETLNVTLKAKKTVASPACSSTKHLKENSCSPNNAPQMPIAKEKVLNILEAMLDVPNVDSTSKTSLSNHTTGGNLQSAGSDHSSEVMNCNLTSKNLNVENNSSNNSKSRQNSVSLDNPPFAGSSWEEDLFCEAEDDFDDIMCSLDEKSFL